MKTTKVILTELGACAEAVKWARRKTPKRAWETCLRGDWLLWIATKLGVDRRLVVRATCACARTALKYVPKGEERPRIAIETAEAWTRGEATLDEVREAARAAYAAADAALYAAYTAAAASASYAIHAASAAPYAARAASYAARAASYAARAAYYAYAATGMARAHKRMARLVRKHIPWSVVEKEE